MNKLILLLGLPMLLSFQTNNHPSTTIIYGDNLEVMNGNVRQLIDITASYSRINRDTINFNKKGEIIVIKAYRETSIII